MDFDDDSDVEDRSVSHISCGPNCTAPKLLVGVIKVERDKGDKTIYELKLTIVDTTLEWTVRRRYSEFRQIRDDVYMGFLTRNVNQCFGCRWFCNSLREFEFPRKHLVSSNDCRVVRHRKGRLDRFARLLAAHTFSAIPKCVRCSVMPFYRIREFFTDNAELPTYVTMAQIHAALVPEKLAAIADPYKSKIEFRRGHGIFKVMQVEKPIYLQWRELDEATRQKRLLRRRASSSSASTLASTMSPLAAHASAKEKGEDGEDEDQVDLEEEKPPTPLLSSEEEQAGPGEIRAADTAVSLQPLRKHQEPTHRLTTTASRWEPWEAASPSRTAAKQA